MKYRVVKVDYWFFPEMFISSCEKWKKPHGIPFDSLSSHPKCVCFMTEGDAILWCKNKIEGIEVIWESE